MLLMHQLALDVARVVHGAPRTSDTALDRPWRALGEGMAPTASCSTPSTRRAVRPPAPQWHRYDLPALPAAAAVAGRRGARRSATSCGAQAIVVRLRDLLDPEVQAQDRAAAAFHRATGARSLLMVPVGVGETGPRRARPS